MNFSDIFKKVVQYFTPGLQEENLKASLDAFKVYLNGAKNKTIRIWVSNAPDAVFRANTVNLLYQLTNDDDANGFGYAGTIEVYYQENTSKTILKELYLLMPSLNGAATNGKVNNATVNLIEWKTDDKPPSAEVNLGFTGAEQQSTDNDGKESSPALAKRINANYLLRLEPYLSTLPEEIQFSSAVKPNINLAKVDLVGKGALKQRAYWTQVPVPEPDWNYYKANGYTQQVGIIQSLIAQLDTFDIGITNNISTTADYELQSPPEERMFEVIAGYMASQMNGPNPRADAKPVVVLSMDDFSNRTEGSETTVDQLLKGGFTAQENAWNTELNPTNVKKGSTNASDLTEARRNQLIQNLKPASYRKTYLQSVNPQKVGQTEAQQRVNFIWEPTLANVEAKYSFLNTAANKVLFVQLGEVPAPMFNYLLSKITLPAVFGGADTANLAIQLGKPYFNVSSANSSTVQYPTTLLGYSESEEYEDLKDTTVPVVFVPNIVTSMQEVANDISFSLETWPSGSSKNPAENIGSFIKEYDESSSAEYRTYYETMKTFYGDVSNDKFRSATSYFAFILQSVGAIEPVDPDPLGTLLAKIYDNLDKDNNLNLFPGVYGSGAIYKFVAGLIGAKITLTNTVVTPAKGTTKPDSITVTGSSSDFLGIPLAFNIVFTAPEGIVVSNWKLVYTGDWLTTELPWLMFDKPYVLLTVADIPMPTQGGVGGILRGLDLDLSIRMPIETGVWQLEGHFDTPASIAKFYQMAGGVNLVQSLPSPFNAFSAIGVTDCQMAYNQTTSNIEYVSFVMATAETAQLTSTIVMNEITFNVLIQNPGSIAKRKTSWSVTGTFVLGSAPNDGTIVVGLSYPGPIFKGQLAKGVITAEALLCSFFATGTDMPKFDSAPVITGFESSFNGTTGDYNVNAKFNADWTFTIFPGAPTITVTDINAQVQKVKGAFQGGISGGFIFGKALDGTSILSITLSANYTDAKGWAFKGKQTTGTLFDLATLANNFLPTGWTITPNKYALKNLSFSIEQKSGNYEIGGETADYWDVSFLALRVRADLKFGYGPYKTDTDSKKDSSKMQVLLKNGKTLAVDKPAVGYYCRLNADIEWLGIKMNVFYDFNPAVQKYGFTWGVLTGVITNTPVGGVDHYVGTLTFTDAVTLGSMIEEAISWATGYKYGLSAPFNLLNNISLNALELTYDFTNKQVSFSLNIGPIDLGFCKIDKISLDYKSNQKDSADNGVFVSLEGSFFWVTDDDKGQTNNKLLWDAAKPETTPAPSGQGNKYFDLRLLAIGQHVTIPGFANVNSVQEAIAEMAKLPGTDAGEIPGIVFDPNSSWLVGMDFGVLRLGSDDKSGGAKKKALLAAKDASDDDETGYFIDMQIVFNDPNLYALRIALSGAPARIFKGLDFQILYRKISDSVGVYMAEIALPDVMRKIQLGTVNITLPVFAIEIYTNGDFLVDLGFPKNADFSRSFTLQLVIYVPIPIPIMGSAGLYFGKKSSATSTEVPVISNDTFNPVLVFGVGIQFGLGYDFNAGILAAGFSLTFVTIIEGVLAKFNPYTPDNTSIGQQADIAPAYYYSIKGVVGIQGKLYGYIDFKIIKAEVNIMLSVLADITIAAYQPILLGLTASVSVSVSVKINLGFFKITISFSFKMTIRASYEIKVGGGASPWTVVKGPQSQSRNLLYADNGMMLSNRLRSLNFLATAQNNFNATPTWSNLNAAATKAPLKGFIGFGLSIAGDLATTLSDQQAVYTAMLFIESVPASSDGTQTNTATDTSFETLSKQIFRWVLAAFHNGAIDASGIDQIPVSQVVLEAIYEYLNDAANPDAMPVTAIDDFMNQQMSMTVSHPSTNTGSADAAYFPVAPKLSMSLPEVPGVQPALSYSFDSYNALSDSYIDNLRVYFDELAVQMQQQQDQSNLLKAAAVLNAPESLATFIYSDYFLLIARQMIHNAQNALSSFQYNMVANQTPNDIISWINTNGQFEEGYSYTISDLFDDNKSHVLNKDKSLTVSLASYNTISEDTFTNIAAKSIYSNGFTAADLATLNAGNAIILQSGLAITYPAKDNIVTQAGNTIDSLAAAFKVTTTEFITNSNVLTLTGLLLPPSTLLLPDFAAQTQDGDTLVSFAARYGIGIPALAEVNANATVVDLFDINDNKGKLIINELPQFLVGELIKEIQQEDGLSQLSGMASRYYLTGLRLPTNGITPNYQGMWVDKDMKYTEDTAGLFSLTGQQFPLPVLQADTSFDVKFVIPSSVAWMLFDNNTNSLDISITAVSDDYGQINTVRSYAQSNYLDLAIQSLGLGDMFNSSYVHYSFSTVSTWQAGSNILLPYSGTTEEAQSLSIWTLPSDLINLADPTGRAVTPRFQVQVGTVDPATKAIKSNPITNYGWGTQVDFTIKKVPLSADSPASAQTYEISGADGNNALLLEKMVTYLGTDDSLINLIAFGFTPNQSNGSNPGVQTDPIANLTIGIAQANLSTFTRPAPQASLRAESLAAGQQEQSNLLNKPTELIRLLWQASITRDGGYYLYYFNTENGEGLPDHAFNDKGEAILSLLTVYTAPVQTNEQDLLLPYMNMFVTGTPVDVNTSTIYAQAAPIVQQATFQKEDTLTNIAYQYFTNVGDVVADNPTAVLSAGIDIAVPEGTYMVTAAAGESFQAIADKFGTTTAAIQAANPLISNWPATLEQYTALRLPSNLTVVAGSNDQTKTLPAIALYYGMDLTALANYNTDKANLFVANTVLNMAGGPITRVATVPPGVLSLEAVRTEPADVPAKYSDPNYALLFLQQNFSILTFKLAENPWFSGSTPSLPVGPTDSDSSASNQRSANQDTTGKWIFKQSVPYSKFAVEPKMSLAAGLPDIASSPYKGIGYLVQPDFLWLDIYGNKILNTLSQSTGGVINEAPILTGYTDALLGVSQWPSVSSSWQVSNDNAAAIQIPLSFDTTQYNGLLSASATTTNDTEILLTFTEALDPVTAVMLVNYKLSPDVSITGAALQPGNTTVKLTVGAMASEMVYTLSIGNIQNAAKTITFDGQATFSLINGGTDLEASSSLVQQATHDFQVYTQLWYQLTDPNGMELSMLTTLFDDQFDVTPAVYNDLVHNWIASIYLYLQDRSQGGITVAAPAQVYTLSFDIDPAKVNDQQIFELTLSFSIARTGGAVMGDFETTGSVKKVTTLLSPSTDSTAGATRGLDDFANSFEAAMSIPDKYYLKISTGADRDKLGQQKPDGTIWAVRLGIGDSEAIAYNVVSPGQPTLFAPRPISNKLESRTGVPIYGYQKGVGINFNTPDYQKDFTEIDLDQWIGSFFSSMDEILTPEFTASIQLVDKKLGTAHLQSIQGSKESLADIAKVLMTTVFEGETGDATAVQEALKQALLVKLMNLYATNSGIQFDVNVKADAAIGTPPNLYGNFMQNTIFEGAVASSDKLREVTLYFSAALDATSAALLSNYTLTAPLTVTGATLSEDGQSVVLTSSADVLIGTTTATISDKLLDANNRTVEGEDSFVISTSYVSYAKTDQLTITAAKIKLDSTATQPLAFLLSAPEIVRGQDGEVLSMINLNLSYKGSDIEHQIAAPINGFTPSSWLSFVLPTVRVPLESQLGGFSVPMFLRSFPQNPSLVNQNGLAPNVDASDISTLLQWVYVFDYSQSYHYPQDTLYFTIDFNVGDNSMFRLAAFPDAFNQLAEFISVYPSIEVDLKTLLTQIDANVFYDTGSEATKLFSDSNIALESFTTIVGNIVTAANGSGGLRVHSEPKPYGSTNVEPYSFEIQEGAKSLDGQQIQVVTVKGKPPVGVSIAEVYIQPEIYQMTKWVNEEDPCLGDVCYYYINKETGKPLLSEEAQNVQQREVQIPGMNILQRQDAMTTVFLTRNENLIPGKVTNPDFVYTTGELSFSNSYLPSINSYQVIEIANLPDNTGQPTQRTLLAQFDVLMETLLKENEEPVLSFQMTCSYDYQINPVLSPISLPVFMQTMMPVTLATDLQPMLQSWTDAINTWFSVNDPNTNGACYKFDLIIFSNLTKQPFPLVRLTNLQLSLVNILPS